MAPASRRPQPFCDSNNSPARGCIARLTAVCDGNRMAVAFEHVARRFRQDRELPRCIVQSWRACARSTNRVAKPPIMTRNSDYSTVGTNLLDVVPKVLPTLDLGDNMSERAPIVYIVDDDEITRRYFDAVLSRETLKCRRVESASLFLELYDPHQAGCLLLDIQMPGMTGIALQHELNLRGAVIPLIFITGNAEVPMAVEAMLQGAFNFLLKPITHQTLLACVRKALDHDADNRAALQEREQMIQRFESLTAREREVLMLLVAGRTNKVMAGELRLSLRTVELHRAHIMEKTGSRSLAQLVRMAMDLNVAPQR